MAGDLDKYDYIFFASTTNWKPAAEYFACGYSIYIIGLTFIAMCFSKLSRKVLIRVVFYYLVLMILTLKNRVLLNSMQEFIETEALLSYVNTINWPLYIPLSHMSQRVQMFEKGDSSDSHKRNCYFFQPV